ncbi:expressed unknown protein [Ectocarpus siliculosus]|uniref:Wbp11/ELF5/Saf1 N-terminal domain-containing protein n=1 Tax=Ectocarpus siliculosus TaxID=2880 RepID=D8LCK5_ECTSI|nr:expressed unknown protein [Ectocarpus siliculosus]|eukprot:CBN79518.1 expressed unknown protein [Ectocarpus siliculosus]
MARTTTRSGRREMNPTDAYRKLQRKKEVQKNKKERKKVREFSAMVRNPDLMVEEVQRMEVLDAAGKLSENDVKRLANLRVTHRVLLKKKKAQEEAVRCAGGPSGFGIRPPPPPPPPAPAAGYTERPYNLNKQGGPQQRGGAHAAAYGPSQRGRFRGVIAESQAFQWDGRGAGCFESQPRGS